MQWLSAQRSGVDLVRLSALLAGGAQRARLLVNGVAGPLSERQRLLAMDILRDLERLCDEAQAARASVSAQPERFELAALAKEVLEAFRFMANRKQLILTLGGIKGHSLCLAARGVVRQTLVDALGAALQAASSGGRVLVEIVRSADRLALDISAPGWDPRLPPAPAPGSGAALSVLRTASGARLVLSVPAVGQV